MRYPLDKNELANAHRRLRKSGNTRFHQALKENNSTVVLAWLESGVAPLWREDRQGKLPITAFLVKARENHAESQTPIGEMPDWWGEIPAGRPAGMGRAPTRAQARSLRGQRSPGAGIH